MQSLHGIDRTAWRCHPVGISRAGCECRVRSCVQRDVALAELLWIYGEISAIHRPRMLLVNRSEVSGDIINCHTKTHSYLIWVTLGNWCFIMRRNQDNSFDIYVKDQIEITLWMKTLFSVIRRSFPRKPTVLLQPCEEVHLFPGLFLHIWVPHFNFRDHEPSHIELKGPH